MAQPQDSKRRINDKDAPLIEAINAGDTDRFYELVQRYQQPLFNFGLRICGQAADAEDMVQDTFLNVFRYLKTFRFESQFKNWLYRIAMSVCIKRRRRSKYAPERELSLEDFLPGDEQVAAEAPAWAREPLDRLLDEELTRRIEDAILALPETYRPVLVLRDLEGFSTEETAQILNLTPGNVKVRLHRARLFIREQLKEYFAHDRSRPA
jgi:RNA polymerase sigma-70 factor (ECF subfamily)